MHVRRMRHRGLVVWLTDLRTPRAEPLLQAVKALVPRHQPIVAAPHTARDRAARGAAAARVARCIGGARRAELRERAQVQVATLRRQGAVVLDEPDDRLDQAVLDAYLQLQHRRRA